jgi:hypothetical protein
LSWRIIDAPINGAEPTARENGDPDVTLFQKKIAGLGLVLVGGLTATHGAATGETWETLLGLFGIVVGAALLALKVVRRNTPDARQPR